jgi:hypothetical protein
MVLVPYRDVSVKSKTLGITKCDIQMRSHFGISKVCLSKEEQARILAQKQKRRGTAKGQNPRKYPFLVILDRSLYQPADHVQQLLPRSGALRLSQDRFVQ